MAFISYRESFAAKSSSAGISLARWYAMIATRGLVSFVLFNFLSIATHFVSFEAMACQGSGCLHFCGKLVHQLPTTPIPPPAGSWRFLGRGDVSYTEFHDGGGYTDHQVRLADWSPKFLLGEAKKSVSPEMWSFFQSGSLGHARAIAQKYPADQYVVINLGPTTVGMSAAMEALRLNGEPVSFLIDWPFPSAKGIDKESFKNLLPPIEVVGHRKVVFARVLMRGVTMHEIYDTVMQPAVLEKYGSEPSAYFISGETRYTRSARGDFRDLEYQKVILEIYGNNGVYTSLPNGGSVQFCSRFQLISATYGNLNPMSLEIYPLKYSALPMNPAYELFVKELLQTLLESEQAADGSNPRY